MDPQPSRSRIAPEVVLGPGVQICGLVNRYDATLGDGSRIGTFVSAP